MDSIYQKTKTFNTSIVGNIVKTIGNGLKKHFTKIAIASLIIGAVGAVAYALKKSGLFKKNGFASPSFTKEKIKSALPKISLSNQDKLNKEINSICENEKCNHEHIVGMLKEDYKKITDHLEMRPKEDPEIISSKEILNENVRISDSGNVFFVGEQAVEAYARILVSSGYVYHMANGWHPTRLMLIKSDHPSFSRYKENAGSPIPLLKESYIINSTDVGLYVSKEAIKTFGKDAEWAWCSKLNFNKLKEQAPSDLRFELVEEIGDELFVALEKGSKKKLDWLKPIKAKERIKRDEK